MSDTPATDDADRTDRYAAELRAVVEAAPPLSARQRERLRLVFRARPRAGTTTGARGTRRDAA
ncbi:hypothetical protein ACIGFK_07425 [Streptomyces sp. NPDC085524]|uniref:hypothetical protein n=1 Tax=unclassified Streptomyces TaxID=2593676 RepID=UPI0035DE14E5